MAGKKVARRKLLDEAVVSVFRLYEKSQPLIERGETEAKSLPKAELIALFGSVFGHVEAMPYYCEKRLCFMVGPEIKRGLGEGLFGSPKQPLFAIGFPELVGVCSLVGALKGDIQEEALRNSRIVARRVEDRLEALDVDPDSSVTPPVYYQRSVSYSLAKPQHPNIVKGASAFAHALYVGSLYGERKQSNVQGLFSGLWAGLMELVVSIFVTYLDSHGSFCRFRVCKMCESLFIPVRGGEDRGIYCGPQCQKKRYASAPVNRCHRNQRLYIDRIAGKLLACRAELGSESQSVSPRFPQKQRICLDGRCPYGDDKPGGGKCEKFINANKPLFGALDRCRNLLDEVEKAKLRKVATDS